MTPPLETSRLLLQPLKLEDAGQVQKLFPQWEVVKYLASVVPWPYPADGSHTFYRDVALPAVERGEAWDWTIRLKTEPLRIIGGIAVRVGAKNRGFWLTPDWHGKGLASEAADAVTDFWFDVLGFPAMRVPKAAINRASRRISEKQAMRVVATEERDYVSGRFLTEIWEITAEEWRAARSDRYNRDFAMSAQQKAESLGIKFEKLTPGYLNLCVRSGNQLLSSGHVSTLKGKLGAGLKTDEGYQAARECAVKVLQSVWNAYGTLDGLRVLKVLGCVNSAPDFIEQHLVINGASDLFHEVFGKQADGYHARSALGFVSLPTGAAVEVEALFEIKRV